MNDGTHRVLVTGSRDWNRPDLIRGDLQRERLLAGGHRLVIVHGACPTGADAIADEWAVTNGIDVERHPADWDRHGKAAGFIRNQGMVALGADVCLAYIRNGSRGATHCSTAARRAGISTLIIRSEAAS